MICWADNTTVHKAKYKVLETFDTWTWVPQCGTRVNMKLLQMDQSTTRPITCERCLKKFDEMGVLR